MIIIKKINLNDIIENPKNYNNNNNYIKQPLNYKKYIDSFHTEKWINKFHNYKKIIIDKNDKNLLYEIFTLLQLTGNNRIPDIYNDDINNIINKYKISGKNYFIRTNKTSLKTGIHGIGPYNNMKEIIESIVTCRYGHHSFDKSDDNIIIYLMNYLNMDIDKEFRVFIVNNKISCISQQNIYKENNFLKKLNDKEIENIIINMKIYFDKNIKNKLLKYENYIMDIVLLENDFHFIEINPFGKEYTSGSACFNWIIDEDIIYNTDIIEFRYVI